MSELLTAGVILGPGGYVLARYVFLAHMFKNKEPSRHGILIGLFWTYAMLLVFFAQDRRLSADHDEACQHLRTILSDQDAEAMDLIPESIPEWQPCDRYSDDYAGLAEVSGQ